MTLSGTCFRYVRYSRIAPSTSPAWCSWIACRSVASVESGDCAQAAETRQTMMQDRREGLSAEKAFAGRGRLAGGPGLGSPPIRPPVSQDLTQSRLHLGWVKIEFAKAAVESDPPV